MTTLTRIIRVVTIIIIVIIIIMLRSWELWLSLLFCWDVDDSHRFFEAVPGVKRRKGKHKTALKRKHNVCAHLQKKKKAVSDSTCEAGPLTLSRLVLHWKITRPEEEQPRVPGCSSQEAGRRQRVVIYIFFLQSQVKEKKREAQTCLPHLEPRLKGSGVSQWRANGTTASPGPWEPPTAPL